MLDIYLQNSLPKHMQSYKKKVIKIFNLIWVGYKDQISKRFL